MATQGPLKDMLEGDCLRSGESNWVMAVQAWVRLEMHTCISAEQLGLSLVKGHARDRG